ncbi:MAG: TPM domain-containing protein [Bdellovibrionales bacterium]|nr:TPM domain-containing protein [Bdellovibrionales bacterium]
MNDYAAVINNSTERELNQVLASLKTKTGVEMAVLTINSLNGESIEQASIKVVDQWQLGTAKEDKGLLLLLAIDDRQLRLEVGQGLEGDIPDAYAKRIIDDAMVPLLKKGLTSEAVLVGVYQAVKLAAPDFPLDKYLKDSGDYRSRDQKKFKFGKLATIIFWLILIFLFRMNPLALLLFTGRGSSYRGGGFGGGSFGGGGGFSGGGASGRW